MLPCRCHKEEQLSSLCFQLNQPLKKIQGTGEGCGSGRGTHSCSAIKWHSGEQSVCSYPWSSRFQLESMRGPCWPASLCCGCPPHPSPVLPIAAAGAGEDGRPCCTTVYPGCPLPMSAPLCVFNGDKCEVYRSAITLWS